MSLDRAELRRMLANATATPWATVAQAGDYTDFSGVGVLVVVGAAHLRPAGDADTRGIALAKPANADLIVAAVNALPILLDALDDVERALDQEALHVDIRRASPGRYP